MVGVDRLDLVAAALRQPAQVAAWPAERLARLLHQARRAGLVGRLAAVVPAETFVGAASSRSEAVPAELAALAALAGHFRAAQRVGQAQQAEIRREARYIELALHGVKAPVVLLKGAAYAMAGLPAAQGRVFGDIDLLVPKAALAEVETRLVTAGWRSTTPNAYDQRYYRQWMHELPPLEHTQRGTALDVHHTILPETARFKPDAAALFSQLRPVAGFANLYVLGPEDMVLHSMTHLFTNDDMSYALRDLSDLDLLVRYFERAEPGFWQRLVARAQAQDLRRPLYWGVQQLRAIFGTPVPATAVQAVASFAPWPWQRAPMRAVWHRVLRSPHPSAAPPGTGLALALLYLRGHWLRMPLPLLLRHLSFKAWMRLTEPRAQADAGV
jgi:hypothetical protein